MIEKTNQEINEKLKDIITEAEKVIKGKNQIVEKVLMAIISKGHVLLEDVPGVGKTTLAIAFSRVMGLLDHRVQFTPDVLPADIVGFNMYQKETGQFVYIRERSCVICFLRMRSTGLRQRHSPRFLR